MRVHAAIFAGALLVVPTQPGCGASAGGARAAFGGRACSDSTREAEVDLMGWEPTARANLGTLRKQGVVAVRWSGGKGCDAKLELMTQCVGEGAYAYEPYAVRETKLMRTSEELSTTLPLGVATFGGKVARGDVLRADYALAGVSRLPVGEAYQRSRLRGSGCEGATHVVSELYLGGFAVQSGELRKLEATAGTFGVGAGAARTTEVESLSSDGDPTACAQASTAGVETASCAAPVRVGLLPIAEVTPTGSAEVRSVRRRLERKGFSPLVLDWPSEQRLELEVQLRRSVPILRMGTETLELMTGCTAPGKYAYAGGSPRSDLVTIPSIDALHATLPASAFAKQTLFDAPSASIDVAMTLVGKTQLEGAVTRAALLGDCEGATHYVRGVYHGGFRVDMKSGKGAVVTVDGDPASCASAGSDDRAPPRKCGGMLRVELRAL